MVHVELQSFTFATFEIIFDILVKVYGYLHLGLVSSMLCRAVVTNVAGFLVCSIYFI